MKKRIVAKHNSGFTLIELLVVMAISLILMYLVMQPVIESFRMTRGAQTMVEAQDSARTTMEQISRDISQAMDVLDYAPQVTPDQITPPVTDPAQTIYLPVRNPNNGSVYWLPLTHSKIDLVMPKMIWHCNNEGHNTADGPRDFQPTEDEQVPVCPVCGKREVVKRPKLPLEQSTVVVRYFVGLRYNNPNPDPTDFPFGWQSPWSAEVTADEGNQAVLYRIEFDPNDAEVFGTNKSAAALMLQQILQDPKFFYSTDAVPALTGEYSGKRMWEVWREKARIVGLDKYADLVYGDADNDGIFAAVTSSVDFRYTKVDKDPFVGVNYSDVSSEEPDSAPTMFRARFGYWTPNTYSGITGDNGLQLYRYLSGTSIYSYRTAVSGGGNLVVQAWHNGAPVNDSSAPDFDITQYMADRRIILANTPANTQMAYYFDFGNNALNFNRGTVNFAMNVEPFELSSGDVADINSDFLAALESDRGTPVRMCRLEACSHFANARVVPGSEVVTGPNMTPGPNFGQPIKYQRVPFNMGEPQYNQYKIDYRTGYIYFSRSKYQRLPDAADGQNVSGIHVDYKIQFNRNGDVVQGDYQTKAVINVHIGIRMFDPEDNNDPPKARVVDLNNTVKVKNAYR